MAIETQASSLDPRDALTVSELLAALRFTVSRHPAFSNILVRGEVADLSRPPSGVMYFNLADASSQISCVLFRSAVPSVRFELRDGIEVLAEGYVDVFPAKGQLQFIVRSLSPIGRGAYWLSFEQVRDRLAAEGLFDASRKRPLPRFPQVIGLVASEAGAAMHDVLAVLGRRYPLAEVLVSPCLVQGAEAPVSIEAALDRIAGVVDVAVVARGGGSLDDLWCFNDERVARAIARFPAPVVSAIGHETDVTIADFVGDVRAPTPSAAAELVSPAREDLRRFLGMAEKRLTSGVRDQINAMQRQLESLSIPFRPESVVRLVRAQRQRLKSLEWSVEREARQFLAALQGCLRAAAARLDAVSPMATIARGFAIVSRRDGSLVDRIGTIAPGETISILVSDGTIEGSVRTTERRTP